MKGQMDDERKAISDYLRRSAQRNWEFRSESDPSRVYTVVLWTEDWKQFKRGMVTCNCPAWLYSKAPLAKRECKHTKEVMATIIREAVIS